MPLECSQQFVQDMKALHPETLFHYSLESGGHGFDLKSILDDDWVRKVIKRFWPQFTPRREVGREKLLEAVPLQ